MADETTILEQASRHTGEIERGDTVIRMLFSLLFFMISELVKTILAVVILFELVWSLITKKAPGSGVRAFADRVVRYGYQIGLYLTYNSPRPPFPFGELPPPSENQTEPGTPGLTDLPA